MTRTILFANLGYARGLDGSLGHHIRHVGRNLYCPPRVQHRVFAQLADLIAAADPDLCCLVEIDAGSIHSGRLDQLPAIAGTAYGFHDSAGKYGPDRLIGRLPFHHGKSNGFMAKTGIPFQRLSLSHGSKRLLYRIQIDPDRALYFAHFSLRRQTRQRQFADIAERIVAEPGETLLLGDFNIFNGTDELRDLTDRTGMVLLNDPVHPTFRLGRKQHLLDLALCTPGLAGGAKLTVIPQPYSDHAALLITLT